MRQLWKSDSFFLQDFVIVAAICLLKDFPN
jgi:hypothetical protein